MKKSDRYLKVVEWSQEDGCYIGRVPGLALGGVHGNDESKVYAELCRVVDEWIRIHEEDGTPLPAPTAGKTYSGKFNLRVGEGLHEQLVLKAFRFNESLNSYCVKVLEKEVAGSEEILPSARTARRRSRTRGPRSAG